MDDDKDILFSTPPNTGIGYNPSPSTAALTAKNQQEDKFLRQKLLGRNAQRQKEDAARRKRNGGDESESEEEVGRSGVGKSGKRGIKRGRVDDEVAPRRERRNKKLKGIITTESIKSSSSSRGGARAEVNRDGKGGVGGDSSSGDGGESKKGSEGEKAAVNGEEDKKAEAPAPKGKTGEEIEDVEMKDASEDQKLATESGASGQKLETNGEAVKTKKKKNKKKKKKRKAKKEDEENKA